MTTIIRARRPVLAALSVVALAVAACGGDDESGDDAGSDDAPAEQDESAESADSGDSDDGGAGGSSNVYSAELEDGTALTVTLDVEESDPLVAPFVAFREQAGVTDDLVWITGSLEAPADYEDPLGGPPTGRYLTFVPPGGDRLSDSNPTSDFACSQLDDWFGEPTAEEGLALNDAYLEILDTSCGGQVLQVVGEAGATTEYVMVVEGSSIPDFESVYAGLLTELRPV